MKPANEHVPVEVIYEEYSIAKEMEYFLENLWDAYEYSKNVQALKSLNPLQRRKIKGAQKVIMSAVQSYIRGINELSDYEKNAREEQIINGMDKLEEQLLDLMDEIDREVVCAKLHKFQRFFLKNKILVEKSAEC